MTPSQPRPDGAGRGRRSRRSLLRGAGALGIAATAGCFDTALGGSSRQEIEPVEPSEPREGTPGEFYYFLEANGIAVDSLYRNGSDLELTYRSEAETVEESNDEIGIVYQVFAQALVLRGSDVEKLLAEIVDTFDEQADGWGINAEWVEQLESGEIDEGAVWGAIVDSKVHDDEEDGGSEPTPRLF